MGDERLDPKGKKFFVNTGFSVGLVSRYGIWPKAELEHLRDHHGNQYPGLVSVARDYFHTSFLVARGG